MRWTKFELENGNENDLEQDSQQGTTNVIVCDVDRRAGGNFIHYLTAKQSGLAVSIKEHRNGLVTVDSLATPELIEGAVSKWKWAR